MTQEQIIVNIYSLSLTGIHIDYINCIPVVVIQHCLDYHSDVTINYL